MMAPLHTVCGRAIPLGLDNVDTDIIIPSRWMKTVTRRGLGAAAFEALRAVPGSIFEDPAVVRAPILIAGRNFGCGSSREHAAWALADMGIRAVIAKGFSDIFAGNAYRNGILTVSLSSAIIESLLLVASSASLTIDLPRQSVSVEGGAVYPFEIDPLVKQSLMEGLDEIEVTLQAIAAIDDHERRMSRNEPWWASVRPLPFDATWENKIRTRNADEHQPSTGGLLDQ